MTPRKRARVDWTMVQCRIDRGIMPGNKVQAIVAPRLVTSLPPHVGKYSVMKELGRGATARVLLARDGFAERLVAVKLFQAAGEAGPLTGLDRVAFLNEAKLVGRFHHPHIVELLDAVAEKDFCYIAMEYVPGGTLARYHSAENLLPVKRVLEVAFKVSRALEHAYRQGVVHRDIKPSNVLVTDAFDVKLSDFGIAMVKDATHTNLLSAGTPAYVAPEQLSNEPATPQSDMYSLGVVMYQLLTGRLPFNASSHASLMYQILNHEPPTPRTARPELPGALEAIVLRALQKKPADRYASWHDFGRDLARIVEVLEPPTEAVSEARKFQALRGLSFFADFSDVEVWETLRMAHWQTVAAGATIIREEQEGDSFYLLVEGEVDVTRAGRHLTTLAPGNCFGEILYFSSSRTRRTTSIQARSEVLLAEIKAAALSRASDRCQVQFNKAFMRILVNRLAHADMRLSER
jgi:hypothetical protein